MLYFPILRTKQGEINALLSLQSCHDVVSPILQIPPPDLDRNGFVVPIDSKYIAKVVKGMTKLFDEHGSLLCYLDPEPASFTSEQLAELLRGIAQYPITPRPLFRYGASSDYAELYQEILGPPNSAVLRLDTNAAGGITYKDLLATLIELELEPARTTLLLDAGDISAPNYPVNLVQQAFSQAAGHGEAAGFDGIAIGSCALPPTQPALQAWTPQTYPRLELELFRGVKRQTGQPLHFADYGTGSVITGPGVSRTGAPKVRYTFDRGYYVAKGQKTGRGILTPDSQYQRLSSMVVDSGYFTDAGFSMGDAYIDRASSPANIGSRGNPTTWVTVNTSHHIELVVSMLRAM